MIPELRTEGMVCRYRQVDIRSLDAALLLASDRVEDNILAVLAGLQDSDAGIRSIVRRFAKLKKPLREEALRRLLSNMRDKGTRGSLRKGTEDYAGYIRLEQKQMVRIAHRDRAPRGA